jgi:hypothetical protein
MHLAYMASWCLRLVCWPCRIYANRTREERQARAEAQKRSGAGGDRKMGAERESGVEESSTRDCCPTQTGRDSKGFTEEDRRLLKKTWRQGEIQADLDRRHHRAGGGDKVEG